MYPFFKPGSYTFFTREAILESGLAWPAMLNIEPTNDCNANCVMCSRRQLKRQIGYMDIDFYRRIIDEAVAEHHKIKWLTLHKDGEPLLHPKISDMIKYAKDSGAVEYTHFNTNAFLMDKEKSEELVAAGIDDITLSVDAATQETYQKVKGTGFLETVIENAKHLMEAKRISGSSNPKVRAKLIDMPLTHNEIDSFQTLWNGIVDEVQVQPIHNAAGKINTGQEGLSQNNRFPCSLLWYSLAVNWDGTVSTCCVDIACESYLGNLRNKSMREIFEKGKASFYREQMIAGNYQYLKPCIKCAVWENGINLFENYNKPDKS